MYSRISVHMRQLELLILAIIGSTLSGCSREKPSPEIVAHAVETTELVETDPAADLRLCGSVIPWKEVSLAFQVAGRVEWVIEADKDVFGPTIDANNEAGMAGGMIGQIEQTRYVTARAVALANLEAASAQVRATLLEATEVIPRGIDAAVAERDRATSQLKRIGDALKTSSVAQSEFDDAQAIYDTAVANHRSLLAKKSAKLAELELQRAQENRWSAVLKQAELDLNDTELRVPFDARVTEVHVAPGSIVAAGTPVASLAVIDPVKVEVVLSSERHGMVRTNDRVLIHRQGLEPIAGIIYQKSVMANPTTRTFTVTLRCRNPFAFPIDPSITADPISDFSRPQRLELNGDLSWFIDERSIYSEGDRQFAWRVVNGSSRLKDHPLDLERVDLQLLDVYKSFMDQSVFRKLSPTDPMISELESSGQLDAEAVFVVGLPEKYNGGKVIKASRRRQLRPGEIVDVQLDLNAPAQGLYVSKRHIRVEGKQHFVFLVGGEETAPIAKKVRIKIVDSVADLHRIEGTQIEAGVRMITSGVHMLRDAEKIQISEAAN